MKKSIKYIIVILLFIIIMAIILLFFSGRYDEIIYKNKANHFLKYLYTLDTGEYVYNDGHLYLDNDKKYFFDGSGRVNIDKYGNTKFFINTKDYCIYKASLNDIKIFNNKCSSFNDIEIEVIKNNSSISFKSNTKNLDYKISAKDDFKGDWVHTEYNGNLTINSYNEGVNYIWFKDTDGNLSSAYTFSVDCLNTKNAKFNKETFYCSGSVINIENTKWIVIKDTKNELTLMSNESLDDRMSLFDSENDYKWSISSLNKYLNEDYYNELPYSITNRIISKKICDNYEIKGCEDDSGCGGYLESDITSNNYTCDFYTSSNVRLLTYSEYNYLLNRLDDLSDFNDNYWLLNSFSLNKGSIIQRDGSLYIEENLSNKNYVRPVITIFKK